MFNVHPLNSELVIHEVDAQPMSSDVLERISDLWEEEKKKSNVSLFNGHIFSLYQREGAKFSGWFVEYRWWIAQRLDSTLFEKLQISPLAVSGLLRLGEGVVFGSRSLDVTQDPGFWELPPSGGIGYECRRPNNTIASEHQIEIELEEELHISSDCIQSLVPFALVEDTTNHIYDIAYDIFLDITPEILNFQFERSNNFEYTEVRLIPIKELAHFLEVEKNKISPVTVELLKQRKII